MRTKRITILTIVAILTLLLRANSSLSGPPVAQGQDSGTVKLTGTVASKISYQGRLTDAAGNPLHGTYKLVFQIWNDATGGSQVGSDIVKNDVPVRNGLFTVDLDVPQSAFNGQALWLRIQVNGQWLSPRQELLPVPYALSLRPGARIEGTITEADAPAISALEVINHGFGSAVAVEGKTGIKAKSTTGSAVIGESRDDHGVVGYTGYSDASGVYGHSVDGTGVKGSSMSNKGVIGESYQSTGVFGTSTNGIGVEGESSNRAGVKGTSTNGVGVEGESSGGAGVKGTSTSGHGVVGWAEAQDRSGVYGHGTNGPGVKGESTTSNGVYGMTNSNDPWVPAIYGKNEGKGDGLYGWSQNRYGVFGVTYSSNSDHAGIFGINNGGGPAAIFKGNVQVRSPATDEILIELGEGLDVAEGFDVSDEEGIEPGTVLVIDPENPGKLMISRQAYDTKVAGVVAGANGIGSAVHLGVGKFDHHVALAGRVYCNVDATYGEVRPGDLLTTSPTPGYAMVVKDYAKAQGAILGKAMEPLEQGKRRKILVLVALQ